MHVLDTDTLTRAHAGYPRITERVRQVGEENVATTVITAIEILRGRYEFLLKASNGEQLLRAQELLQTIEQPLQTITILSVRASSAAEFDRLARQEIEDNRPRRASHCQHCTRKPRSPSGRPVNSLARKPRRGNRRCYCDRCGRQIHLRYTSAGRRIHG
jgi:predicted nucleic acid-binding protein